MRPVLLMAEVTMRLEALTDLPPGWDGSGDGIYDRGRPPPSKIALQRAGAVARSIARLPNAVDPDANGGIGIWYYGPDRRDVACYCRNSGDVAIVTYQSGMWTDQLTLRFSVSALLTIEHVTSALAKAIAAAQEGASACPT